MSPEDYQLLNSFFHSPYSLQRHWVVIPHSKSTFSCDNDSCCPDWGFFRYQQLSRFFLINSGPKYCIGYCSQIISSISSFNNFICWFAQSVASTLYIVNIKVWHCLRSMTVLHSNKHIWLDSFMNIVTCWSFDSRDTLSNIVYM